MEVVAGKSIGKSHNLQQTIKLSNLKNIASKPKSLLSEQNSPILPNQTFKLQL
jgi:hypothetical protein